MIFLNAKKKILECPLHPIIIWSILFQIPELIVLFFHSYNHDFYSIVFPFTSQPTIYPVFYTNNLSTTAILTTTLPEVSALLPLLCEETIPVGLLNYFSQGKFELNLLVQITSIFISKWAKSLLNTFSLRFFPEWGFR